MFGLSLFVVFMVKFGGLCLYVFLFFEHPDYGRCKVLGFYRGYVDSRVYDDVKWVVRAKGGASGSMVLVSGFFGVRCHVPTRKGRHVATVTCL